MSIHRIDMLLKNVHPNGVEFDGAKPFFPWDHYVTDAYRKAERMLEENEDLVALVYHDPQHGAMKLMRNQDGVYLNTYLARQAYGGPEEGGWWYDTETVESSVRLRRDITLEEALECLRVERENYEDEDKHRDYYSVNATGMHRVRLEPYPGEDSPKERPRYE